MNNQYTVAVTNDHAVEILAPDNQRHREYFPGDAAETLANYLRLATDEAARLNNVGVTYRLEKWCPKIEGLNSLWQSWSVFTDQAAALHDRDDFSTGGELWRVVRQTREVLP